VQVPVLVEMNFNGAATKLMLWGNRNGYFYALGRETGKCLLGAPFVRVNWSSGLDERGRPIPTPQPPGQPTWPGNQGATKPGRYFVGGNFTVLGPVPNATGMPTLRRGPINNWTEAVGTGAVLAIDPNIGQQKWKFEMTDVTDSGIMTTASDLLFTGGREAYFQALDARSGKLLWKTNLGGQIVAAPISFMVDGKQYVSTISGNNLVATDFFVSRSIASRRP
jgi:alcohol dehydrogenase (cytochrome c)